MTSSTFYFNSTPSFESFTALLSERTGGYSSTFTETQIKKGYLEACKIQRAIDYRKNKMVLTLAEQGFQFVAGDDGNESYCYVVSPSGDWVGIITEQGDFNPG